ncbi:MAG: patatin-like phospholipase family protein [Sphingobium sp.]
MTGASTRDRALVLGAGGVTGIAWLSGLVHALTEQGVALADASLILGTSAGAVVAVRLFDEGGAADLFARQVEPERQVAEIEPPAERVAHLIAAASEEGGLEASERLARRALLARETPDDGGRRRAVISDRIGRDAWPSAKLRLCAVDVDSTALAVFDADTGVSLIDAVAASCAVPGIWPPVRVGDRVFMDGGVRSTDNSDLATGWAKILVLAPISRPPASGIPGLEGNIRALEASGSAVLAVTPDTHAQTACGLNPFSPERRPDAARAGYDQGRRAAEQIKSFWG